MVTSCNPPQISRGNRDSARYEGLPVILINTSHPVNDLVKVNGSFEILTADTSGRKPLYGRVETRDGDLSAMLPKKSFSAIFPSAVSFLGLPENTEWILNASFVDKTFMRDALAYHLFYSMEPKGVLLKVNHAEVYLNGKYSGLYCVYGKPSAGLFSVDNKDEAAFICKEPELFVRDGRKFNQVYPGPAIADRSGYVRDLQAFIFQSSDKEFTDPVTGVFSYFDRDNLIAWHLILIFANNDGGLTRDFYLYRRSADKPIRFALWDYDHSFGRTWDGRRLYSDIAPEKNILLDRLVSLNPDNYKEELKQAWHRFRNEAVLSREGIMLWIDSVYNTISPFAEKNFERYPCHLPQYPDSATFAEEVMLLKSEVDEGFKRVERYIDPI